MSDKNKNPEMTAQEGGQVNAFVSPHADDIKKNAGNKRNN